MSIPETNMWLLVFLIATTVAFEVIVLIATGFQIRIFRITSRQTLAALHAIEGQHLDSILRELIVIKKHHIVLTTKIGTDVKALNDYTHKHVHDLRDAAHQLVVADALKTETLRKEMTELSLKLKLLTTQLPTMAMS